ncbi:class I SAM-dependent methyltransferase [Caldalkalibacillus mannanilyticus]|uniref:class I SAM-dependent methyltransferase n=1 Tax=Caldalkalibacillus mannanilyticus TaxID=1418 RepID=UPI00046938D4|nr:class I SAM-dependent methyltransferase [Caldalkalibacillus mannanilyticus]
MTINFHDEKNKSSYTTRTADDSWIQLIHNNVHVSNKQMADIGCGGGIYTKALLSMGAAHVTGVDFSEAMLKGAAEYCHAIDNVTFRQGDAYQTTLPANQLDIVLERALIHHLKDIDACFKEAYRVLKKKGFLIIQDRTPQDCLVPGSENHIRGYFFEKFPHLIHTEVSRRYDSGQVKKALETNGFRLEKQLSLWETRCEYLHFEELEKDLLLRAGRSILHELTDEQLCELVAFIRDRLPDTTGKMIEKDLWTIWIAQAY